MIKLINTLTDYVFVFILVDKYLVCDTGSAVLMDLFLLDLSVWDVHLSSSLNIQKLWAIVKFANFKPFELFHEPKYIESFQVSE
ncbi:unnamed protein product [Trichobilharzia szidati]|nr:unnamed protein product [Trichobilharzia szidati]